MKDPESSESEEKSYIRFFRFLFLSYGENSSKIANFEYINDHISKTKNRVWRVWRNNSSGENVENLAQPFTIGKVINYATFALFLEKMYNLGECD